MCSFISFLLSFSLSFTLSFFLSFFSFFLSPLFLIHLCGVRAAYTRGCGCILKASLHTHTHAPRWQFVVPHTDNDLHFSLLPNLMALCLWVCNQMKRDLLYEGFYWIQSAGNTCFACDWLLSLVLLGLIISGLTVSASSLAVNDILYLLQVGASWLYHVW